MKSELVEHSPVRKELKIEIPAETVAAAHRQVSNDYARQATLPGFRQGRAPVSLVQRRFKSEIASETLRKVMPKAVEQALQEHELQPLGEPDVRLENADGLKELGAATVMLHCHVEVMPLVEVKQYKGLAGIRRARPMTEEKVDELIERWRGESASMEPVEDRGAQNGDTATVELKGRFSNNNGDDFSWEEVKVELGAEANLPEIDAILQGAQVDDELSCVVTYPRDFSTPALAGKEVEYSLKVIGLHLKQISEADDAWALSLDDGYDSFADLKEKVRAKLQEGANLEARERLRGELFKQMVDAHDFEVPRALVKLQTDRLLEDTVQRLTSNGFNPNTRKADFWRSFRDSMKPQGEYNVRGMLLINRIAELESIEVTPEERENYFQEVSAQVNRPVDEVRALLTKDDEGAGVAASLRNRKTLELLVEHAAITEGEWFEPGTPELKASGDAEVTEAEVEAVAETPAEAENTADAATSEG